MISVLAFPKYKDKLNPYLINLNKYLDLNSEIQITEFSILKPFCKRYDIFHLHWPDYFFVRSIYKTFFRIIYFLLIICVFKLRKTKLIWTIHNLEPHENHHPWLNYKIVGLWSYLIDGYTVMSEVSSTLARRKYPILKQKKMKMIYHSTYENYQNIVSKSEARKKFKIEKNSKVLLFFGNICNYKNIPLLISEFKKLNNKKFTLIIAGNVKCISLKKEIIKQSKKLNIQLHLRFIFEHEVQFFFNASDIVILPFKNILNSGSAMLALSFRRPIFCPNIGSLTELRLIFGFRTINTYSKFDLNKINLIVNQSLPPKDSTLTLFSSKKLSYQLFEFYVSLI